MPPDAERRCSHCKGSGADPDDEGEELYGYGIDPWSIGPCPACHGTGETP